MEKMFPEDVRQGGQAGICWKTKLSNHVGYYRRGGERGKQITMKHRSDAEITTPVRHLMTYEKVKIADAGTPRPKWLGYESFDSEFMEDVDANEKRVDKNKETRRPSVDKEQPAQPGTPVRTSPRVQAKTQMPSQPARTHSRVFLSGFSAGSSDNSANNAQPSKQSTKTTNNQHELQPEVDTSDGEDSHLPIGVR